MQHFSSNATGSAAADNGHIPFRPRNWLDAPQFAHFRPSPIAKSRGRGRPKLIQANRARHYLWPYFNYRRAVEAFPALDDILTGVSRLDFGGNTRPLSVATLYRLLQLVDPITAESVMDAHQCKLRQGQRLAGCLRIAEAAFMREAARCGWQEPDSSDDWIPDYSPIV